MSVHSPLLFPFSKVHYDSENEALVFECEINQISLSHLILKLVLANSLQFQKRIRYNTLRIGKNPKGPKIFVQLVLCHLGLNFDVSFVRVAEWQSGLSD